MASILDNSGDIIIQATLTALGRQRAAAGGGVGRQITKFCVFDDEIDYALYDKNNASGSAYADLEIMQTPIFQPQSKMQPTGKYGLITRGQNNTLFMVQAKRNEKITSESAKPWQGIYYLSVNDGVTAPALQSVIGNQYVLQAGLQNGLGILIETGIDDSTAGPGDQQTKQKDIISNGLAGGSCTALFQPNLISQVLGPSRNAYCNNNGGNGRLQMNMPMTPNSPGRGKTAGNKGLAGTNIRVVDNQMVYRENDQEAVTQNSVIASARAGITKLNFQVQTLTDTDYSEKGRTDVTANELFGSGDGTYRIIDTMVSVQFSNGATDDLPVRIIKKNS